MTTTLRLETYAWMPPGGATPPTAPGKFVHVEDPTKVWGDTVRGKVLSRTMLPNKGAKYPGSWLASVDLDTAAGTVQVQFSEMHSAHTKFEIGDEIELTVKRCSAQKDPSYVWYVARARLV